MEQPNEIHKGHIENMGVLNLLSAKTADDFDGISHIENVGCILIPEHLTTAFMKLSMENVGSVVPVPQDGKVNVVAGQARFTGEALAQGDPDTMLVVAGQMVITTVVTSVGFRGLHIAGQLLAPVGSEAALLSGIGNLTGQAVYYKPGARMFMGHEKLGREFLELIDEPIALMITGHLEFEDDVTPDLLRAKISEIALCGHLEVPRHLLAMAQLLTTDKSGQISARD